MEKVFFDSWESILRSFIITILAYAMMVFLLRTSGKRALSKMNAFDFIVTIALGSSLATVALNKNIALIDGVLVFALLIFMQYAITWLSVRKKAVKKFITGQPSLLLYKGELFEDVLKRERITINVINSVARKNGFENLAAIDAMVLETTGEITVISHFASLDAETMANVEKEGF